MKNSDLMFYWVDGIENSIEQIKKTASMSMLTISAVPDDGSELPLQRFQFLMPIGLESRQVKLTAVKDSVFELFPAGRLSDTGAPLIDYATKFKIRTIPAEIPAEPLEFDGEWKVEKWKIEKAKLQELLPKMTLKEWDGKQPLCLTLNWEAAASQIKMEMNKQYGGKTPTAKKNFDVLVGKLLEEIREATTYDIHLHMVTDAEDDDQEFLLAYPK